MCRTRILTVVLLSVLLAACSSTNAEKTQRQDQLDEIRPTDDRVRAGWIAKWEVELKENAAAWDAWRDDLKLAIESDAAYAAAVDAVRAAEFAPSFDSNVFAALVVVRDEQYRSVARHTYEKRFGRWQGDEAEFAVLVELANAAGGGSGNIAACADAAVAVCGEGRVSKVTASVEGACSVICAVK